jgi:UDP-N-acetylmuramate dehydrogenase
MNRGSPLAALARGLHEAFGGERLEQDKPLGPLTTFKVGGPADLYLEPRTSGEILTALRLAHAMAVPVTLLGGGSNVLVADAGVRGLVLRPRGGQIARESAGTVRADAAVTINGLVRWLISHELAGLEAWAGTPGTVGGGIYGNAHWSGRLLSEYVEGVRVASRDGEVSDLPAAQMAFGYDRSRLQHSGEVLLSAVFTVTAGDAARMRETAKASLAYRKRTQPLASSSAGCIFQNPAPDTPLPPGVPRSAGALIDRVGLKGAREGDAEVSTTHANFIVNHGGATAADIRALVRRCQQAVADTFGVRLLEEIVYLGEFGAEPGGTRVDTAH